MIGGARGGGVQLRRQLLQRLLARAGWLIDGAKVGGAAGYETATRQALRYAWSLRAAVWLQQRTGHSRLLAYTLSTRFEALLISNMVVRQLGVFTRRQLTPLLGADIGKTLAEIVATRLDRIEQALEAMTLQYPDYAQALERRYLERVAAQLDNATDGKRPEVLGYTAPPRSALLSLQATGK